MRAAFFAVPHVGLLSSAGVPSRSNSTRPRRRETTTKQVPATLLAAALRAQSEGVFIAERSNSPQGLKILFANESFCLMTGRSTDELVGRPHGMLHVDPAEVERLRRWL